MANTLITPPTIEPVTLQQAKNHARVSVADDDTYIEGLITAARRKVESLTQRQLIEATRDVVFNDFPRDGVRAMFLDCPPAQSVTHVKYYDTGNTEQTLAAAAYQLDAVHEPARIVEAFGYVWPQVYDKLNAVTVRVVCGYGATAASVPDELRLAVKMLVAHWYEHREAVEDGKAPETVPLGFDNLINAYRMPFAA